MNKSERILFFGFTGFADRMKASAIKTELEKRGYQCFFIEQPHYSWQIMEILIDPEQEQSTEGADMKLPEPFILFCGMNGEILDDALQICRGNTRAVLTVSNSRMTPYELSEHLLEEKMYYHSRPSRLRPDREK